MNDKAAQTVLDELKLKYPKISETELTFVLEGLQIYDRLFEEYINRLMREENVDYSEKIKFEEQMRGFDKIL